MRFPRFILVFLIITAVIGVAFIASASISRMGDGGSVLGESVEDPLGDMAVPEGVGVILEEPVQLPEIMIKKAGLPENQIVGSDGGLTSGKNAPLKTKEEVVVKKPEPIVVQEQPYTGTKKIVVRLKSQTMDMVENGEVVNTFKVSSGKRGMQTPTGTFKVLNKNKRAFSSTYGLYMPYWMAFTTLGHGIHELPEWPNGYKEGEDHLGTPVSHGCVRLGIGPAKTMFEWAEVGTPVEIVQS